MILTAYPRTLSILNLIVSIAATAILGHGFPAAADSQASTDQPSYLIFQGQYRQAALQLESAQEPYTLQSACSRATLLIYAGRPKQAEAEFESIRDLNLSGQLLADYGEALCALMQGNVKRADADLDRCMSSPDYADHRVQIDLARAVAAAAIGDSPNADRLCAGIDSPLAADVIAMSNLRKAPKGEESTALLRGDAPWSLPGGVPRVTELPGLRATVAIDLCDHGEWLNPCLADSPDADAVFAMLNRDDNSHAEASTPGSEQPTAVSPAPPALSDSDGDPIADTWRLLILQPSYMASEMILSDTARKEGNKAEALKHFAIAAAIDPHFVGSLQPITDAYAGREPLQYSLPSGSRRYQQGATARSPHNRLTQGIWRGNPHLKEIALTFDDGPSSTNTPALLDELVASHAPATFFVVGERAQANPAIVRRMHAMGDEVEDHTYTHPNLDEAVPVHIYEEILRNAVVVQALTGVWPHFLRPPGGQSNPRVLEAAAACGMAGAFWSVDVLKAEDSGSSDNVVNYVLKHVHSGSIILMHNGAFATTQAIPKLTSELRARGYKLVTLLTLAKDASPAPG